MEAGRAAARAEAPGADRESALRPAARPGGRERVNPQPAGPARVDRADHARAAAAPRVRAGRDRAARARAAAPAKAEYGAQARAPEAAPAPCERHEVGRAREK